MPLQFNEFYDGNTGLTVGIKRLLFSEQTQYQLVEVYETESWGNLMVIDGMVMLSEKDEFVYHEMLTHVPLFTHPNPEVVLIIGGGDGGTAREVMKHPSVKKVDLVEIDESVVEASKRYLPEIGDFDNPKLQLHIQDGTSFINTVTSTYDVILIDGSDPVGPAEGLFKKEFFERCYRALSSQGVLATQTETPWVDSYHMSIRNVYSYLDSLFKYTSMYLCYIPLYPSGMWSMMCASKADDPAGEVVLNRSEKKINLLEDLRYYNLEIHRSSFALPGFVSDLISVDIGF